MRYRELRVGLVAAGLLWSFSASVSPASEVQKPAKPFGLGRAVFELGEKVPMPTLGGKQFWGDELFFHQWRIQRNVVTGHCRLLDAKDLRHTWGTYEHCRTRLDEIRRDGKLPPMQGKAVICLHGLCRSRSSMAPLARYLEEHAGYTVFNVEYPSTRRAIADHAEALAKIIENLDGIEEINFVAHSLGNIVVRRYLADQTDEDAQRKPDGRIRRFVMLGPPNHGSIMANTLLDNKLVSAVWGKPGQELGREWVWLEADLVTPACEFAVVAGGLGNERGFNPSLPGDDDGVVTVASARLEGATDFTLVPVLHSLLMRDARVKKYTLQFLQTGGFMEK